MIWLQVVILFNNELCDLGLLSQPSLSYSNHICKIWMKIVPLSQDALGSNDVADIKTLCELKRSKHILLGRLCTRGLKSIPNFIINFLCVSLHLPIVLSDFRISKTSSKRPDNYLELAYCTKHISENFLFQYFPSYTLYCV